ncbi:cytochrome b5 [Fistulina hepatica ATCC 64428]|uniref:Cytochrome b5 n=1 Tax=Fistulina hepatica ATCC 64428 TaxID=1128425 RepID=A0A0D7ABU1_9AGAR|nr:cytochrome b5 [Fistulina hepatica ATCC 64428]
MPPPQNSAADDSSDSETEYVGALDDDAPPAFPSLASAQRATAGPARNVSTLTDAQLMPPPSVVRSSPKSDISMSSFLSIPRSTGVRISQKSTLAVPPTTTQPPKPSRKREKVALTPGHSYLDWANLKTSGTDLRGVNQLMRIPPSELKKHNKRGDAWSAFNGKVYNITPFLPFHPGGERELLRVSGRDGTKLFALTHAWVNVDYMLDACLVGFLVPES